MVAIGEGLFIGSEPSNDYSTDDFMNHSCEPTVGMGDEVTIVARRDIYPGTELTADYAIWLDNPDYAMKGRCNCASSQCRCIITGRDWARPAVQQNNRGFFSPFLRERIAKMNLSGASAMDVLITGGSRGIGRAIAEELVGAGHRVMIVARNAPQLQSAVSELTKGGEREPLGCQCDVANAADRRRLVETCKASSFTPSVLVLNAGTFFEGTLSESRPEDFAATMQVNLDACYHLVQAFVGSMSEDSRSRIILIGSTAAYEPYPLGPLYGVSKWALRGYAVNLRKELRPRRIGVTFVAPGGTWTDLWKGEPLPDDRLMLPSDVGRLVRTVLELSPQAVVEEVIVRPMLGDIHE